METRKVKQTPQKESIWTSRENEMTVAEEEKLQGKKKLEDSRQVTKPAKEELNQPVKATFTLFQCRHSID